MLKTTKPLPPDWYESFEARGQDDLDEMALQQGLLPSDPRRPDASEPSTPPATSLPNKE